MENQLTLKTNHLPQENEFQILLSLAKNAAISGLYNGVGSEQKILMVLLAARELGIPPMQALNGGLWNIQGKIEISGRLMNAMIRRAGHSIVVKECNSKICIMEGKRADSGDTFTAQFSIEDAIKAGIANRTNWKAYAEDMLYARAMSRLARRLFPDVIGTAYVEGEIRDSKIETIEATPALEEKLLAPTPQEENAKLNEFLNEYSEEEQEYMRTYLQKYANHWKKNLIQSIEDYSNKEKFLYDYSVWRQKQQRLAISQPA